MTDLYEKSRERFRKIAEEMGVPPLDPITLLEQLKTVLPKSARAAIDGLRGLALLESCWNERGDQDLVLTAESYATILWHVSGRPRYVLADSLAARFALTRSTVADPWILPFPSILVEVPQRYLPSSSPAPGARWIFVYELPFPSKDDGGEESRTVRLNAGRCLYDTCYIRGTLVDSGELGLKSTLTVPGHPDAPMPEQAPERALGLLATRLALNTLRFVTAHRACVVQRDTGRSGPDSDAIFDLAPPRELTVDRVLDKRLRDHAAELVKAQTLTGIRHVLQHVVTGHWKRQAMGPGGAERVLRWISPYLRGSAEIGTVVEKLLRVKDPQT